jgi:NAD(P)-dependent dehydrogenase (short-subunit alcohol dehydrogenase family)
VTGGSGGIGKELVEILYQRNARVYMAARSSTKAKAAIEKIQRIHHRSIGQITYLHLDLNDLTTIKKSVDEFLAKETRLDVLWNNAGVMFPPSGAKTAQGYELQLGTNNLATFLFTHHLLPILKETAKTAPEGSVRVVWVSSSAVGMAPKPAIDFSNMDYKKEESTYVKYGRSKAGSVLHSVELARRTSDQGVLSLVCSFHFLYLQSTELGGTEPQPWELGNRSTKILARLASFYIRESWSSSINSGQNFS